MRFNDQQSKIPVVLFQEDGGWAWHTASAFSEWIVATAEILFFSSYTYEFSRFDVVFPKLVLAERTPADSVTDSFASTDVDPIIRA